MREHFPRALLALCAASACASALAKLPPPTPEAAAKAAAAAAKTAWTGKVGNYQLCLAQDRIAAHYRKTAASAATPACTDPGPFVYTPAAPDAAAPAPLAAASAPKP